MKLDSPSTEAVLVGNIKNNVVGINEKNIGFITSLLTSNLYSKPLQSFIRETVSNAWDSQIEAGTTNEPILIRTYKQEDGRHIAIRDYGTGLSPERFRDIYLSIGSSTKRDSNDYIGQLGIGRLSCLAVGDIVLLTNYYNNVKYKYIMYKDNLSICIDELEVSETEEQNGLEVDVLLKDDITYIEYNFLDGLDGIKFFDKVYVSDTANLANSQYIADFNQREIYDFDTFKTCTFCYRGEYSVLMGNVLYPLSSTVRHQFGNIVTTIYPKCSIGDLSIVPNREALLYDKKTNENVQKACDTAIEELKRLITENNSFEYKDVFDYWNKYKSIESKAKLFTFNLGKGTVTINIDNFGQFYNGPIIIQDFKFNACKLNDINDIIRYFLCSNIKEFCYYKKYMGDFITKDLGYITIVDIIQNQSKILKADTPYKPVTKRYVKQLLGTKYVLKNDCRDKAISLLRLFYREAVRYDYGKEILRLIYDAFIVTLKQIPVFNNSDVPKDYEKTSTERKTARKCVIYQPVNGAISEVIIVSSTLTVEQLGCFKGTVIYGEKGNPYTKLLFQLLRNCDYVKIVEVASSNLHCLEELTNSVSIQNLFVQKNNILSRVFTYKYLYDYLGSFYSSISYFDSVMPENVYYFLKSIESKIYCNSSIRYMNNNLYSLYNVYVKNNWLNNKLISSFNEYKPYIDALKWLNNIRSHGDETAALYASYLIHNKIYNSKTFKNVTEFFSKNYGYGNEID